MNRLNSFTRLVGFGALAIGSWTSHALAQDSLQVTFVGDRELEIREVTKPPASPQRVDLGIAKPTIQYAPVAKGMSPVTEIEALAPLAVRMDAPLPRLYAGYAKLGFGMYTSPYADIHLGETQSRRAHGAFTSTTAARPAPRVPWTASAWMKAGPTTVSTATSADSSTAAASRWMRESIAKRGDCTASISGEQPRGTSLPLWIGSTT